MTAAAIPRDCETCACGSACPILARRDGSAWREEGGALVCLLYQRRLVLGQAPADPYAGQRQNARYKTLARDPITGRPIIP